MTMGVAMEAGAAPRPRGGGHGRGQRRLARTIHEPPAESAKGAAAARGAPAEGGSGRPRRSRVADTSRKRPARANAADDASLTLAGGGAQEWVGLRAAEQGSGGQPHGNRSGAASRRGPGPARGSLGARWPSAQPVEGTPALHVIGALDDSWDADHDPETVTDTLVVPLGSTVRWQLVSGLHTLTSGSGPADPAAGRGFDYLLDPQHAVFDSTFRAADTLQFFCYFHEPRMRGVVIISANASVPDA